MSFASSPFFYPLLLSGGQQLTDFTGSPVRTTHDSHHQHLYPGPAPGAAMPSNRRISICVGLARGTLGCRIKRVYYLGLCRLADQCFLSLSLSLSLSSSLSLSLSLSLAPWCVVLWIPTAQHTANTHPAPEDLCHLCV